MLKFFIVILISLAFTSVNAQVKQEWVSLFSNATTNQGIDLVTDNSGNVYVTGLSRVNRSDILTIKYDASGQQLWSRFYNRNILKSYIGYKIGLDLNQDIVVCGSESLSGAIEVVKYNSSGDTLWTRRYIRSSAISNTPINMKIDYDGSIYITLSTNNVARDDFTIVKYLTNGDLEWVHHFSLGEKFNNNANDIVLGKGDFFYLAGFSANSSVAVGLIMKYNKFSGDSVWSNRTANTIFKSVILDSKEMIYACGNQSNKYYTSKIDPDGNTLWEKVHYDTGGIATKIGVDSISNVYVSGYNYLHPPRISIIKYNSAGDSLWKVIESGVQNSHSTLGGMIVDGEGNSYICGSNSDSSFSSTDMLTFKYNSSGNKIWLMRFNYTGTNLDFANAITGDPDGNIIVTGSCVINPNSVSTTIKYSQTVSVNNISNDIPESFSLYQNFPNPFNPKTVISYELRVKGFAKLIVYDVLGNEVSALINEKQNAGTYSAEFDGSGLASGVYFYSLNIDGKNIDTKRMVLLK